MRGARLVAGLSLRSSACTPALAQTPECLGLRRADAEPSLHCSGRWHPRLSSDRRPAGQRRQSGARLRAARWADSDMSRSRPGSTHADVVLPDLDYNGSSADGAARATSCSVPAPLIEGAARDSSRECRTGLFAHRPSGLRAARCPPDQIDNFGVDADARRIGSVALGLGFGGAASGSCGRPGHCPDISLSVMRRDIPRSTLRRSSAPATTLRVTD